MHIFADDVKVDYSCIVNKYVELNHTVILLYFEQNLLHQTWLIARFSKILWGATWWARVSEIWKAPPKRRF